MPNAPRSDRRGIPAYTHHKPSGQARVRLPDGKGGRRTYYLGPYGSPESRQRYERLIAEWLAQGRRTPIEASADLTVTQLCAVFWRHAKQHYRLLDGAMPPSVIGTQVGHSMRRTPTSERLDFADSKRSAEFTFPLT